MKDQSFCKFKFQTQQFQPIMTYFLQ